MHKMVDDFMARAIAVRPQLAEGDIPGARAATTDTSLTSRAAYAHSAAPRLLAPSVPPAPQSAYRVQPETANLPARSEAVELTAPLDEAPRFSSRSRRADAWERERQRESHGMEHRQEYVGHRGS
jgi:hypothetical protein